MPYKKQLGHTIEYSLIIALLGIVFAIVLPILKLNSIEIGLAICLFISYGFIFIVLPTQLPENDIRRRFLLYLRDIIAVFIVFVILAYLSLIAV